MRRNKHDWEWNTISDPRFLHEAAPTAEREGTMNGVRKDLSGDFKGRRSTYMQWKEQVSA